MTNARWFLNGSGWHTRNGDGGTPQPIHRFQVGAAINVEILEFGPTFGVSGNSVESALAGGISSRTTLPEIAEHIVRNIWGPYLAVIADDVTGRRMFLPDPMQSVRIYYREGIDGHVEVDVDLAEMVSDSRPVWNVAYLVSFAATQFGIDGQTPFLNVKSPTAGSALQIERNGAISLQRVWFPQTVDEGNFPDFNERMSAVFGSMTKGRNKLFLALSGGVDSSAAAIFLRSTAHTDADIHAVHFYSSLSPDLHEEKLARTVANAIGAEFSGFDMESYLPFSDLTPCHPPAVLNQRLLYLNLDKAVSSLTGTGGAIFEGQGGDLLFHAAPDAGVVRDAFAHGGLSLALNTAEKLARLRNTSIPLVLANALKLAATSLFPVPLHSQSLGHKALFTDWSDVKTSALPGYPACLRNTFKRRPTLSAHLTSVARVLAVQSPLADRSFVPRLNPYLTQPIVEATLQMSSYASFTDDVDRIELRKAAHRVVACDVLWRKSKGAFDAGTLRGLQTHRRPVEEMIRAGVLVRSGYLDARELTKAFESVEVGGIAAGISLALISCVEMFCASWDRATPKSLALPPVV